MEDNHALIFGTAVHDPLGYDNKKYNVAMKLWCPTT